jgi:hypothetical protein
MRVQIGSEGSESVIELFRGGLSIDFGLPIILPTSDVSSSSSHRSRCKLQDVLVAARSAICKYLNVTYIFIIIVMRKT